MANAPLPELPDRRARLSEVARLFLKLGFIAFGGPAAHIAMMRDEVVDRRHWLSQEEFLDLVGGANLIPGPSSTELALFLGYRQVGLAGLLLAGALFIGPAMLLVMVLAAIYVRLHAVPAIGWLLYGLKPVVIAIVLVALWNLGRTALKNVALGLVCAVVVVLYLAGINPLPLLFAGGLIMLLSVPGGRVWSRRGKGVHLPALFLTAGSPSISLAVIGTSSSPGLLPLFLTFLKIGAILYGSGYVLLAFIQNDFVHGLGWLSSKQVLDAVAIGQITPGPVFTTATFIGYLVLGVPGALLATLAIFLPAFVYTPLVFPLIPRLRQSPVFSAFLDGVNASALGLMAGVSWTLGRAAIVDPFTGVLAVAAVISLMRYKLNAAWLIAGGGIISIAYRLVSG